MELYLLKYNNYYNRQARRERTLDDYMPYLLPVTQNPMITQPVIQKYSFKPNDGIRTYADINWYGDIPDYVLVVDFKEIISRWFVLEATRLRDGQYRLQLYRDTIADYWDDLTYSTAFIEKGMIDDVTNPLLYNAENMSFNQLRDRVHWLYDSTKCPWIVGYIPQDFAGGEITINNPEPSATGAIEISSLADWNLLPYTNKSSAPKEVFDGDAFVGAFLTCYTPAVTIRTGAAIPPQFASLYIKRPDGTERTISDLSSTLGVDIDPVLTFEGNGSIESGTFTRPHATEVCSIMYNDIFNYASSAGVYYNNALTSYLNSDFNAAVDGDIVQELKDLDGKVIRDASTGIYYSVQALTEYTAYKQWVPSGNEFFTAMASAIPTGSIYYNGQNYPVTNKMLSEPTDKMLEVLLNGYTTKLEVTALSTYDSISVTIPAVDDRVHCIDQPFDIFCMPYSDTVRMYTDSTHSLNITSDSVVNLRVAQAIGTQLGSQAIFDIQIVPYCPVSGIVGNYGVLTGAITDIRRFVEGTDRGIVGKMWWASSSTSTFNINLPASFAVGIADPLLAKVKSQTQFGRLCAPNYSQYYDFNIQKNRGCEAFLAQCNFRPYNPWFKITPVWKSGGLYYTGDIEHDGRGLVLNGDFSVAQATSAWANYELTNKNYLNIFNRQVENTEFGMAWDRAQTIVGSTVGVAQGAVSGAMAGGIPGAIVGGVASTIGGGLDIGRTISTQYEALDYTRDMFEYRLGNIKAIPQGLARTAAQSAINTFVPTFEVWETTDTEEQLLYNKITYNGMTVDAIGMLGNWLTEEESYLKCQLIRCPSISDFHLLNTISGELYKGVFISELSILN